MTKLLDVFLTLGRKDLSQIEWHMPVIPALKRQEVQKFKIILSYTVYSLESGLGYMRPLSKKKKKKKTKPGVVGHTFNPSTRTARALQRNPVSKKTKQWQQDALGR